MQRGGRFLLPLLIGLLAAAVALLARPASASPGWEKILDRPTNSFGSIDFVSDSEGWMVAGAGLLHTTDGGATWSEAAQLGGADVHFADAQHGWLVGGTGTIYATTDGGVTWNTQSSGTQVHLQQIVAKSSQEAWILGVGEGYSDVIIFPKPTALLHTTDGGVTWQSIPLPANTQFSELAFAGSSGWLLGSGCTPPPDSTYCGSPGHIVLLRTTDAGATWTLQQTDLPGIVHSMTFADDTHGWLSASACTTPDNCIIGVYRTSDGGGTWMLGDLGSKGFVGPLAFRDSTTGWVVERDCNVNFTCSVGLPATHVLRTEDGGVSWRQVGSLDLPSPMQSASALVLRGSTLYLTGSGIALRSQDDGVSWQAMAHPAISFDSRVDFVDKNTGYVISRGDLLRTDDGGRTWHSGVPIPDGAQSMLAFITPNLGFTSSRNCIRNGECTNTLWRTADSGQTWQPVLSANDENAYFGEVRFAGDLRGYAALNTGFAKTSDGGVTWEQHPAPDGWTIPALAVADAEHLWAIFETIEYPNTHELRSSTDGGRTWRTTLTLPGYADNLTFVNASHGWYVDYTCADQCIPELHMTSDGGTTWREHHPAGHAINDLAFVDPLNGWANVTSGSQTFGEALLHTADGGETWTAQLTGDFVVGQLEFVDVEHGWFALSQYRGKGIGGGPPQRTVLYRTTDAGGGPIGRETKLPDLGGGPPPPANAWWLAPALVGAALLAASFALRRPLRQRDGGKEGLGDGSDPHG